MSDWYHVYVVFRVDHWWDSASDPPTSAMRLEITAKEVLPTADEAMQEATRLNGLNEAKNCRYFWQSAKFYPDGRSPGEDL